MMSKSLPPSVSSKDVTSLLARIERLEERYNIVDDQLDNLTDYVSVLEDEVEKMDRAIEFTLEGVDAHFDAVTERIDLLEFDVAENTSGLDEDEDEVNPCVGCEEDCPDALPCEDEDEVNPCVGCEEDCPDALPLPNDTYGDCHSCESDDCDVNVPITVSRKEADIILNLIAKEILNNKDMYGPDNPTKITYRALFNRFNALLDQ